MKHIGWLYTIQVTRHKTYYVEIDMEERITRVNVRLASPDYSSYDYYESPGSWNGDHIGKFLFRNSTSPYGYNVRRLYELEPEPIPIPVYVNPDIVKWLQEHGYM